MVEFVFSIIWLIFTGIFTFAGIMSSSSIDPMAIIVIALFWIIGIFIFIKGLRKVIKNHKTEKYGEECYGIVNNIYPTGTYINHQPEFKADFIVYIPSLNKTETISEVIGLNYGKYPIQSLVKCKYYENDVNIQGLVDYNSIPLNIRPNLDPYLPQSHPQTTEDIITVNGVQYQKVSDQTNTYNNQQDVYNNMNNNYK